MSSIDGKNVPYFDSLYLSEEFQPFDTFSPTISGTTSSPYCAPYYTMSSINTPFGPSVANRRPLIMDSMTTSSAVRNHSMFSPVETQRSTSAQTYSSNICENGEKGSNSECNESKIEFKILVEYLENLRQNKQTFQTNILRELKQMREVMSDLKKSIQEMPIRFADALTQCLDSVNGRSDSLSVDSEPEFVEFFDKIDIKNDSKDDNSFVDFCDNSCKSSETETVTQKSDSIVDKFVFEYNPYLDLDKWLKKD